MVAIAILGIALGGLYSAASGATRNVRADERYAYAVELGRSLLADHNQIPRSGVRDSGVTAGGPTGRSVADRRPWGVPTSIRVRFRRFR